MYSSGRIYPARTRSGVCHGVITAAASAAGFGSFADHLQPGHAVADRSPADVREPLRRERVTDCCAHLVCRLVESRREKRRAEHEPV